MTQKSILSDTLKHIMENISKRLIRMLRAWKTTAFSFLFICLMTNSAIAISTNSIRDLTELDIQELMEIKNSTVHGASKYEQKLTEAPASVSIVTAADIQQYGYRTCYLNVKSEPGKGTTFTLYFPVVRKQQLEKEIRTPAVEYLGAGEKILVVDDVTEQRNIANEILVKLGYQAHTVSSGEAALEYLAQNGADLVILDMIMDPGIDGLETYRRIIEIKPRQKAIIVSGFSETKQVREAHELGAGAYIQKPYVIKKLGIAVREELIKN